MATTTAKPNSEHVALGRLCARAETTLRQVQAKERELQSLITVLKTALGEPAARRSPLDELQHLIDATAGLRLPNGNLSAALIAKLYGVSLSELAGWLGKNRQTVSKTPDADALQAPLGYFERVARLLAVVNSKEAFRKWLRTANDSLDHESPLELMRKGEWQVMADFVDDILTGAPS